MPKKFETREAQFCDDLFERITSGAKVNPMFKVLLSSVGNLIKMVESDPDAQGKVREIMDDICQRWPEIRVEVTVDAERN